MRVHGLSTVEESRTVAFTASLVSTALHTCNLSTHAIQEGCPHCSVPSMPVILETLRK